MSARLIGELAEWLLSPAAADVTPHERLVLFVVAERSHEKTRLMLRHRGDDLQLVDRIAEATGLARDGALKKAFQRLAKRGLEVRIPLGEGKDGRPVFTHEGHSMRFRLPEFPASASIPEGSAGPVDKPAAPVGNPVENPPDQDQDDEQRRDEASRLSGRGETKRPASGDERRDGSSRPTPSNYIDPSYKHSPSTSVLSSVAEVEDAPASPDEPSSERDQPDEFTAARAVLNAQPDFGQQAMDTAAKELPGAGMRALVIRAAQLASKGIPA